MFSLRHIEQLKNFELGKPNQESENVSGLTVFEVIRATFLGEGAYGRVFATTGFLRRGNKQRLAHLALKFFHSEEGQHRYKDPQDINEYVDKIKYLREAGLSTFSSVRVVKHHDATIGLAMTELTLRGHIVFSINELQEHMLRRIKRDNPAKWEVLLKFLTDETLLQRLREKLISTASAATENKVFLHKDCFFFEISPNGDVRIIIGDLDNVHIRPHLSFVNAINENNKYAVAGALDAFHVAKKGWFFTQFQLDKTLENYL